MKVYIAYKIITDEHSEDLGVFSTSEKAEKFIVIVMGGKHESANLYYNEHADVHYCIIETEVDKK